MSIYFLLPIIFISSFVLTMVGLGGGLIFSPLFVLLDFPISHAVSASLFLNGLAAISATYTYARKKMVDLKIGLPLLLSSSISAPFGAILTRQIDIRFFSALMAAIIFLAAVRMLLSKNIDAEQGHISTQRRIVGGVLIGAVIGVLAGLMGIGGGVFIVPLLIYVLKVPTKKAAATSIFIVVFSSFSAFLAHASISDVDWHLIVTAGIFSLIGGRFGSRIMAEKLKGRTVRRIFGVVLLIFCLKLLQKAFLS